MKKILNQISVAIRATNERTMFILEHELREQLHPLDSLMVFSDQQPFAEKMMQVYHWCLEQNKPISLVIDADILVRSDVLEVVRSRFRYLPKSYSGFGLLLFDRFFMRPKFRGLHVYRTSVLPHFIENLPEVNDSLRPETDLKLIVAKIGYPNHNDFVKYYVAGVHDFFQWYHDIYFKMLVRSKRSPTAILLDELAFDETEESIVARAGIEEGLRLSKVTLDKSRFINARDWRTQEQLSNKLDVDLMVRELLMKHYGPSMFYLSAVHVRLQKAMNLWLRFNGYR